MPITDGMMSPTDISTAEWGTPQELFDSLDEEFHFDVDVCASPLNHKCDVYWTKVDDAFVQDWSGKTCWMNPVYGSRIGDFMRKAASVSRWDHGAATVVCLVPARTDTKWWHDTVWNATEVRLIRGRLKFEMPGEDRASAPFPSAIVIFSPNRIAPMPVFRPCDTLGRPINS